MNAYSKALRSGDSSALSAWRDLANLLLHTTVAEPQFAVRLTWQSAARDRAFLESGSGKAVQLLDGRWLRIWQSLAIRNDGSGPRVKVLSSSYQFQADADGREWFFRYDYERSPQNQYPGAHLQINGVQCPGAWAPETKPLGRVHFPTRRISLEAVLRLLIEDFGVEPVRETATWRAVLVASEEQFDEIATRPSPGPAK